MTPQTRFVLLLFLQDADREWHGYAIAERLRMVPSRVYRILGRLAEAGWLTERWEVEVLATILGRSQRHLYRLTGDGLILARRALAGGLTPIFMDLAHNLGLDVEVLSAPHDPCPRRRR